MTERKRDLRKNLMITALCVAVAVMSAILAVLTLSLSIRAKSSPRLISAEGADELSDIDHIIILGAGLKSDGSPSDMLADRLTVGAELLKSHPNASIILTGDNSGGDYNEVASMKKFLVSLGIDENILVEDGRGYSTYESIYRAANVYNAHKVIIVTQEYHLYRALYISERMGIDAYGVSADTRRYYWQAFRNVREHIARVKDFFMTISYDPGESSKEVA